MQNDWFGGRFFGFGFDFEEEEETCENISCQGTKQNPVCGEYKNIVQPYRNKCEMKKASCSIARNLYSIQAKGKVSYQTISLIPIVVYLGSKRKLF